MSDWIEQYSAALTERDARELAHKRYIDAYTKLADRTALLEANPSAAVASSSTPTPTGRTRTDPSIDPKGGNHPGSDAPPSNDLLAGLRTDLASTQRARATLQAQVEELTASISALQTQNQASSAQIAHLSRQKADVERKLRDRDEELKGKGRLVEQAQDEMVALGLQLNVAEEQKDKLTRENQELVDRWMKRMGEEAERVNRDSRWA
ncbi:hypothetical protein KC332_g8135 [Hortaea werneckii]|uniref:Autophagy-related protein 16 domain-containing protein n=2 Tax=Hortaea werneckii TaxID=91943 RepID=A0A3M7J0S5_HORWE|nr:hypothetical protein KC358_g12196 [Hortaea werneckii]OTA28221.1 hypothetical protein BTJ68_10601 [Hortaea werneckii EXF-2000]KAI6815542.1 hypothetical protein KC350_g10997 [Hortaea werneckii]KAI6831327.1 hypothetical protein KC342_g7946 [Hortaea werneckii]KAI6915913.1 hypothetical protein KC348_g11793 [Hortaea werneckii]